MKFFLAGWLALALAVAMQAHADARSEVQRAFEQVVDSGGFRGYAQGHVFGPVLPAMAGEIEVVFPDRIHASTDQMEFVTIGERAWLNTLGVWTAVDRSLVPVTAFDMAAMRRAIASIRDARVASASKTSQCAAQVYRFRAFTAGTVSLQLTYARPFEPNVPAAKRWSCTITVAASGPGALRP